MTRQVPWSLDILENFIKDEGLEFSYQGSTLDADILRSRVIKGWTVTRQSMEYGVSRSTVNRRIDILKKRYDMWQKKHPEYPKRKRSAAELYMDEN